MALIKCPECELQVSDKALSCPHCGFPMQDTQSSTKRKKSSAKRRRLPNGFGSITELKNKNLRNPFYVRICVGKNEFGKPVLKSLKPQCLFPSYQDAYSALMEYNKNPYDLDADITVAQLYEKWTASYFENIAPSSTRTITSAWTYCSAIYNMRAKDVRARHIKGCMDEGYRVETQGKKKGEKVFATAGTKARIKSLFNLMFDYGLEYEIVDRNYARTFEVSDEILKEKEETKRGHIILTDDELELLWKNVNHVKFADWVLIHSYMGWRPQELAKIRLDEVNLEQWYIQSGMKTAAGKQRIVPIHSRIRNLVRQNYENAISLGSEYLFNDPEATKGGMKITYDKYAGRFDKVIAALNLNSEHRPHDPRMTFITRCKKAGVDEYALKLIVGHKIEDITEAVYTDRDLEWLREDLEKIK